MAGIWSFRLIFVKNLCLNYYSRNLVSFNVRGDKARVFQRVSINLNTTVGQAASQLLCRYTQSILTASCVCWIVPISTLRLYQKNLWLFMFEMHLISGITSGWQVCQPPPAKLNVKTGPLPWLYFGIYYSFGFGRLLFFCVFRSVFRWFRVFV